MNWRCKAAWRQADVLHKSMRQTGDAKLYLGNQLWKQGNRMGICCVFMSAIAEKTPSDMTYQRDSERSCLAFGLQAIFDIPPLYAVIVQCKSWHSVCSPVDARPHGF